MHIIAERLKRLRELKGLSQRAFSELLGIKQPSYSRYETSDENRFVYPGSDIVIRICKIMNCRAGWLLGLEDGEPIATIPTTITTGNNSPVAIGSNITQNAAPMRCKQRR